MELQTYRTPISQILAIAAVLAAGSVLGGAGVMAKDAASSIAERFASDGKPAPGASGAAPSAHDKAREDAKRAVDRALAQLRERKAEGEREVGGAVPDPVADPAKHEADAEDLAEKLRDVRRKRASEAARPADPPGEGGIVSEVVSRFATHAAEYISPLVEKRVTVMLEMEVGKTGVRRWSKTADPMLCIHENCYLSRGAEAAAEKLSRAKAFGPSVALGKRGQACRSKPACIFRDIDLETVEAKLQPVDLKFIRHDRREAQAIRADTTCAIIEGALSCRNPVEGKTWKAWVVPESVARRAGAEGLKDAMAKGLE
ncbi:MAG: hypothetical protein K0U74_16100 [Alphaproteobacteria bacterium]|nr:hypothetical protein [Alphaproteobacteria bacterium]